MSSAPLPLASGDQRSTPLLPLVAEQGCAAARLRGGLRPADFQRVMGVRPVARSAHFVVHFLAAVNKLSTGGAAAMPPAVDDLPEVGADAMPHGVHAVWRLGLVLPKRLARRSVTRSLIKHQARELWRIQIGHAGTPDAGGLPAGDWVLRLKAPWPVEQFPSAASVPLKAVVRDELQTLLAHCIRRTAVPEGAR